MRKVFLIEVKQGPVGVYAVTSHAASRTSTDQMNDLALRQIIHFPSSILKPEAIVHVFKIHEESFIQKPDLLHGFLAQHQAGAGNILHFHGRVACVIGSKIRTYRLSQEEAADSRKPAPGAVTGN